ncbi:MAG: NAD(P)/FAD-dependent oxidoreductase [Pseudomonadales bacterium]
MNDPVCDAIIIGAGFSGMAMAIELQMRGVDAFRILEKAGEVGGTWRENTYPGAECDIASALYSYSFEHNAGWEYKWSGQQQIHDYQRGVADKYGIYEKTDFGQEVISAQFDDEQSVWRIRTAQGEIYCCRFLISAVGQLHIPHMPRIDGQAGFCGEQFHSAKWRHDIDLVGKRVAVIGNAASALQFIPEIAPQVAQLTVFQRSANWVVPKMDRPYSAFEQKISARFPWLTRLYRFRIWLRNECVLLPAMRRNRLARWALQRMALRELRTHIADPELRKILTPDYPIGAKRMLVSDNYYPALARENVRLQTSLIEKITSSGIACRDGSSEDFDIIIYGTGFQTNPFLAGIDVSGAAGKRLNEHWQEGAHAYLGVVTHGFPNFFMLYGPNTNLGHNSILIMSEAQARYIAQTIIGIKRRGVRQLEVKPEVESVYNRKLQEKLAQMAFSEVKQSWYMDGGRVTNNWAGSTLAYRQLLKRVAWDDFVVN